jgi:hypothetical protein
MLVLGDIDFGSWCSRGVHSASAMCPSGSRSGPNRFGNTLLHLDNPLDLALLFRLATLLLRHSDAAQAKLYKQGCFALRVRSGILATIYIANVGDGREYGSAKRSERCIGICWLR